MRLEGRTREFMDKLEKDALPAFLRQQDMRTVSVSPFGERHSAWWFYAGFNEMYNTGKSGGESAEEITPTVLKWIDQNAKEDNWFLHVNYWDPHTYYRAPAEFGNPFKDEPTPDWLTEDIIKQHNNMVGLHGSRELAMFNNKVNPNFPRMPGEVTNVEQARMLFDGYDCGIRYMDGHIGMIFDALAKQGVMDDLCVIITSDHGENMGELQLYAEHATADRITTRIPMIVRWPGGKSGRVDDGLYYNLDLSPTLAELFSKTSMPRWDGASYAKSITQGADCGRDYLVVSQCAHTCQRGVRFGPWMYMRTYHDFFHLFPDEMLFDVTKDPHEQNNLADQRRDVCMDAVYKLSEWHDEMMMSMDYDADPLWTVMREGGPYHARGHLKNYCEYLEQTGRSWAIPELKKRHPGEFE
jgi:arylsulfatase A-like enzyme